jgi:hypothetical protein
MAQATGSKRWLAFIQEATFGATPATPQTQLVEFISFSGNLDRPIITDASIRSDRQIAYARAGNESVKADLEVAMCASNFDVFLEAALQGTWATNVLTIPASSTQRSFAIEEGYTDLAQYHTFNGCTIDSVTVDVSTDGLVTTKFSILGATESAFSATSIDSTPTAVAAKPKFYHVGGTFKEGGTAVGYLSAISWTLKNNLVAANVLGTAGVRSITSGKAEVTGKATALFEDATVYNKWKNNTDTSIEFTLTDGTNSHTYLFPKVKYVKGSMSSTGDGPVTVELEFNAIYDTTAGTSLKITRV